MFKKKIIKIPPLLFFLVFILLLSACKGQTPSPTATLIPPFVAIIVNPDIQDVNAGQAVALSVDASGQDLRFKWAVARGRLSAFDTPAVIYTAPSTAGVDTVTVEVSSAGSATVTKNKSFNILVPPTSTNPPTLTPTTTLTPTPELTFTPIPTGTSTPEAGCVLEDFEGPRRMSWWSLEPAVFSYAETSEQAHGGARSLRVEYSKSDTYQFLGAEVPSGLCDFSKAQSLRVWVYGDVSLLLKLEDKNGTQADVSKQKAADPYGWSRLTFDYSGVQLNLHNIKNIFFFPAPGDASASGIFYLDDIGLPVER
jgi:hypothetical protein